MHGHANRIAAHTASRGFCCLKSVKFIYRLDFVPGGGSCGGGGVNICNFELNSSFLHVLFFLQQKVFLFN